MLDANRNTVVKPQGQARIPDDGFINFFFNFHTTVYVLQLALAAIVFIILLINGYSYSPTPMIYICFVGNMFCLNKHVNNVRENQLVVDKRWRWGGAFILLVSGSAYPLSLHAKTLPQFWVIFAWVVFGIHFPLTVLLNWGLRKVWLSLCQKAIHSYSISEDEMLGPYNYPFPTRGA